MTVARDGPTSAMRAKKTRNAVAVQTRASATTDAAAFAGTDDGHETAAAGAQAGGLSAGGAGPAVTGGGGAGPRGRKRGAGGGPRAGHKGKRTGRRRGGTQR